MSDKFSVKIEVSEFFSLAAQQSVGVENKKLLDSIIDAFCEIGIKEKNGRPKHVVFHFFNDDFFDGYPDSLAYLIFRDKVPFGSGCIGLRGNLVSAVLCENWDSCEDAVSKRGVQNFFDEKFVFALPQKFIRRIFEMALEKSKRGHRLRNKRSVGMVRIKDLAEVVGISNNILCRDSFSVVVFDNDLRVFVKEIIEMAKCGRKNV